MLVYMGYSAEYVYNYIRELLSIRVDDPQKCLFEFIDSFILKEKNFKVYFSFSIYLSRYKQLIQERLKMVF